MQIKVLKVGQIYDILITQIKVYENTRNLSLK